MLIFLYGPDTYRLLQKAGQIVEEYKKQKRRGDFSVIDALSGDPKVFLAGLGQASLFQEKKFFVVKNPIANKDFKEMLVDNLESIVKSGHNIVFCQEGKVLKNDRLLAAFKRYAEVQEFLILSGAKLTAWINNEFRATGSSVEKAAAELLALWSGGDLWRAKNEIQKLVHRWPRKEILTSDVEREVNVEIDSNIFKTIDAAAARDKKQALKLIREHIDSGDHPLYLLTMIANQFRNIVLVKSAGAGANAARLGINPFVFGKTVPQARRFGLDEVKNIYRRICQTDFDIKTGRIPPEVGLDLLIAQI